MVEWLRTGDWSERAKAALSLYVVSELPDRSIKLERALATNELLPEEIRQQLRAVLKRLEVERLRREQEQVKQQIRGLQARMPAHSAAGTAP